MNVVDSSGWIEFFTDSPNASYFQTPIRATANLLVPSICIYEVVRHGLTHRTHEIAMEFLKAMSLGAVIDLDTQLAATAAMFARDNKLAMADAIILATARQHNATLWTQDADFERFEGVKYRAKSK